MTGLQMRPSRDEFRALAGEHTVVPVWTEVLADLETPVASYAKLVGSGSGFLLESVEHGERWSRYSFVGRDPVATLELRDGVITTFGQVPASVPLDRGMLAALDELLRIYRAPIIPDLPPLQSGVMGYLGYDIVREVEHLPDVPHDDRKLPDAAMSIIGSLAAFDHWRQRVYLIESVPVLDLSSDELDRAYEAAIVRVERAVADLARPLAYVPVGPPQADDVMPEVRSTMPNGMFQRAVEVAKEHIVEGDIFQVVLSQRYDIDLDADPFDFYRVLRQVNPSPYMYFLKHPDITIVGSSPEPMVQVLGRKVISRPIAGTRRRGRDDDHDRRMAGELKENPKEVAEHIMLVDLARNDVGRIAKFGSVHVDELMTLERYSHVMHLTSQVSGELVDGKTPIDVLRATLPAGTVSGAPKVRAMEIIDELEPVKRGPYAGVVGYVDFSGNLDTAIAIRTMFVGANGASFQAGAGIVADSSPDEEDLECRNKAAALLAAVPAARRMTAAHLASQADAVTRRGR
jgi:anthranilate synthase component I